MKKALSIFLAVLMMMSCAALSLQALAANKVDLTRIDFNFTCNPTEGAKVGSDYTLSLSGTADDESASRMFEYVGTNMFAVNQEELCAGGTGTHGEYLGASYIVITKDDNEIVYPYHLTVNFAPKKTKTVEDSDPTASHGDGAVYEAGHKYNYYLVAGISSPYKLADATKLYRDGSECNRAATFSDYVIYTWMKYKDDNKFVYLLDTRNITHEINTVNITFSCNPEDGAAVGSDYDIVIDANADLIDGRTLSVCAHEPLINLPTDYNTLTFNQSLVAIYESDTLLYPGYEGGTIYYAPARKATAHGSDPTGALGVGETNTPAFYENGKTYQYYATFKIDEAAWYSISDSTAFYVNGIKVTDMVVQQRPWHHIYQNDHCYIQIPVATVTCGHTHTMTFHEAVAATVTSEGNVAYYHCDGCGKNFADEAGTQEIDDVTIAKLPNPSRPSTGSFIERLKSFFERIREFFRKMFGR